jgi:beta-lactamase class A
MTFNWRLMSVSSKTFLSNENFIKKNKCFSEKNYMDPLENIEKIFSKYTTAYHFYLRDLVNNKSYELGTKKKYPICSCFKLGVLMAYFDSLNSVDELFVETEINPSAFSRGGGILNFFSTNLKFTHFQLAQMMMAFSDATSTDVLIEKIGIAKVDQKINQLCTNSRSTLNLDSMVKIFQSLTSDVVAKSEKFEKFTSGGNALISANSFTDALDLNVLALEARTYVAKNEILQKHYFEILKTKKQMTRTDTFFPENVRFIGKTGSIGFGHFVSDCGVIELNGEKIAVLSYATEGWELARELVEIYCSKVGVLSLNKLGISNVSWRWNEGSENVIRVW